MTIKKLRERLNIIIFGTDTPAGKNFDVFLLWFILASIIVVCLESVPAFRKEYYLIFEYLEWMFTIFFTLEYIIRIYVHPKPFKYIFSFYGLIDLLAFLPGYFIIFVTGGRYLVTIRVLRLLRIFRILKLRAFMDNAALIRQALAASFYKITVFMLTVFSIVLIIGSLMYVIEGDENGFTSIPRSIYWTIVTITTVGYGDITPQTVAGQVLSSLVMLIGYAIIAVPTGIVGAEFNRQRKDEVLNMQCTNCTGDITSADYYCRHCGHPLKS